MDREPLVSIVTPCLNAERFIERTISSVLAQDYPRIEYHVMDGRSSDKTLAILERYRDRLTYTSAPDSGAADAIHRGLSRSSGSILAWLNADDLYMPGAVSAAVRALLADPDASVLYGEAVWIDENDRDLGRYPTVSPYRARMFERDCTICQPAAFFRGEAYVAAGGLDPGLRFAFDYDLWIRLSRTHRFTSIPRCLAASRMHRANLTLGQRKLVFEENIRVLQRHFGYVPVKWVYGYMSYLRDGRDQFFEPLRHSLPVYLASLPAGTRYNIQHPLKYCREWISLIGLNRLRGVTY